MLIHIRRAVVLAVIALVLTFAYAFLATGVSQVLFKHQADGSITANGSTLIGQNWSQTKCPGHPLGSCVFQGRPDALGPYAGSLNPVAGGGDNPLEANNIPGKPGVMNAGESGAIQPRSPVQGPEDQHRDAGRLLAQPGRRPHPRPGHHLGQRLRPRHHARPTPSAEIPMVSRATGMSPGDPAGPHRPRRTNGASWASSAAATSTSSSSTRPSSNCDEHDRPDGMTVRNRCDR